MDFIGILQFENLLTSGCLIDWIDSNDKCLATKYQYIEIGRYLGHKPYIRVDN